MANNLFETQYDLTKKSKFREFYESYKIWIYSIIFGLIIIIASYSYYKDSNERKKILLSENYIQAKVHLENGNKDKAVKILKSIIFSNDSSYSTLSFLESSVFVIMASWISGFRSSPTSPYGFTSRDSKYFSIFEDTIFTPSERDSSLFLLAISEASTIRSRSSKMGKKLLIACSPS